jgi:hypothetical protein
MTIDTGIEEHLKSQMGRVSVRLRPDLAQVAYRAHRRHRAISRSVAAVAAAAVVAASGTVAALATTRTAAPVAGGPGTVLSSYDVPLASARPAAPANSLTAAVATQEITWARTAYQATPARYSAVTSTFTFGSTQRVIAYEPSGTPYQDTGYTLTAGPAPAGVSLRTTVDYATRTWSAVTVARAMAAAGDQAPCTVAASQGLASVTFAGHPDASQLLGCPGLTASYGQHVGGTAAVKVSDKVGGTLWISAAGSLPIMLMVALPAAQRKPLPTGGTPVSYTTEFGYLPASRPNVAHLAAYVPPGFPGLDQGLAAGAWTAYPDEAQTRRYLAKTATHST